MDNLTQFRITDNMTCIFNIKLISFTITLVHSNVNLILLAMASYLNEHICYRTLLILESKEISKKQRQVSVCCLSSH